MRTILFTNARNENNIVEWVTHHLRLGFTTIFIFDHKSTNPIYPILLREKPNRLHQIVVIRINKDSIIKTNLMMNALKYAMRKLYDWLLYLDCDEFLVLNKNDNISSFLTQYIQYDQVGINWLFFGSNFKQNALTTNESIIHSYTRSETKLDKHIKSFIHLRKMLYYNYKIQITNPHYYFIHENQYRYSVNVNYKPYNPITPHFIDTREHFTTIPAFIAHYCNQSYENYIQRKILLPRDDSNTYRTIMSIEEFHKQHNNIINTHLSKKYPLREKNEKYLLKEKID